LDYTKRTSQFIDDLQKILMDKVDLQKVVELYKQYNEGDKFKEKLIGDMRKISMTHNKKMFKAIKGVNAKVDDLEHELGQEMNKGFIPPFLKNNMERCASCNTDLSKKKIKSRI